MQKLFELLFEEHWTNLIYVFQEDSLNWTLLKVIMR